MRPEWANERAAELARRFRERLGSLVDVLPGGATLVAFRPPAGRVAGEVVDRLAEEGVVIRELPNRELLRASVGWWSNEDDLERLSAGLAGTA
jgi:histidinol-phosphate/aromatic aminotransferase/cobyric acid decarboxylase-like protein